ncbi:glycosyltransferase [Sphingomonas aerolata]|uniref:glycosyltransferase n=1 Tax=Sphingomonas aerolata TaxID=185951 RepID=UPI002FE13C7C
MFEAFADSALAPLQLVVVGADRAALDAAGLTPPTDAVFVGRCDDATLRALYMDAHAQVFPSRTEGFGLPPLEAMLCGCPAIVAPAGTIPEMCRDAVLYADVDDPAGWRQAIAALADPVVRSAKRAAGYDRAAAFRWDSAGRQLLNVIERVARVTDRTATRAYAPAGPGADRSDRGVTRQRPHYAALDGLRGLAAISVLLFHLGHWQGHPWLAANAGLAVDFFFCLSGYVLSVAYRDTLDQGMATRTFAVLRLVRLMPLVILGTLISAAYLAARIVLLHDSTISVAELARATAFGLLCLPMLDASRAIGGPQVFPLNGPAAYAVSRNRRQHRLGGAAPDRRDGERAGDRRGGICADGAGRDRRG